MRSRMHWCEDRTSTRAPRRDRTKTKNASSQDGRMQTLRCIALLLHASFFFRCLSKPIKRKITIPFDVASHSHRHISPNRFNVTIMKMCRKKQKKKKNNKIKCVSWHFAYSVAFLSFILCRRQLASYIWVCSHFGPFDMILTRNGFFFCVEKMLGAESFFYSVPKWLLLSFCVLSCVCACVPSSQCPSNQSLTD